MSLGILNNVSAIYAENNLNNTQSKLQTVLQQLSSGSRINSGADDAAGLAIADGLKANEAALTQSTQNASDGVGLLQTADGALSQVTNLLDRAVTLATEAANGTLSTNQVSSANQEYQSIIAEIGNIGSTTNFNGNSVFGSQATAFYVGDGTSTGSNFYSDVVGSLNITSVGQSAPGAGTTAVLAPGVEAHAHPFLPSTTIVNGSSGTAATETFTAASAQDTLSGTLVWSEATGNTTASITFAAGTSISSAIAQINANASFAGVTAAAATNGFTLTSTNTGLTGALATTGGAALVDTATVAGSQTYNLANAGDTLSGTVAFQQGTVSASTNFAAGTSLSSAIAQINATGSVFAAAGITATAYAPGATALVLTSVAGNSATFGSVSTNTGSTLVDSQSIKQLGTPVIANSSGTAGSTATFAALQNPTTDDVVGTLRVAVGVTGTPISVQFQAGTTLAAAVTQLNSNAQLKAANIVASANASGQLVLTGPSGTTANPTGSTLVTTGTLLFNTPSTAAAGAGTDFTSSALATLTSGSAQNILTGVNAAIANVAYQRGILGADSNELTAASNTAASENVNLTAAESSLRSTNYGQATSDLAKYEVLSQTGISALAQANSVQQEILKLLQ